MVKNINETLVLGINSLLLLFELPCSYFQIFDSAPVLQAGSNIKSECQTSEMEAVCTRISEVNHSKLDAGQ